MEECIQFLGRVPEAILADCYAAADCFVLPTRALECFGLIVLEAFAAGTPVIASRSGAIPKIAGRRGDEWLFEPGDDEQLAVRMRRFLSGDLPCSTNLRQVAEEFDREKVLARRAELITRCQVSDAGCGFRDASLGSPGAGRYPLAVTRRP